MFLDIYSWIYIKCMPLDKNIYINIKLLICINIIVVLYYIYNYKYLIYLIYFNIT